MAKNPLLSVGLPMAAMVGAPYLAGMMFPSMAAGLSGAGASAASGLGGAGALASELHLPIAGAKGVGTMLSGGAPLAGHAAGMQALGGAGQLVNALGAGGGGLGLGKAGLGMLTQGMGSGVPRNIPGGMGVPPPATAQVQPPQGQGTAQIMGRQGTPMPQPQRRRYFAGLG